MNKHLVKQVSKVIGKKLAVHELSILESMGLINPTGYSVSSAISWYDTPQGGDFWMYINRGQWPYNYTRGKS